MDQQTRAEAETATLARPMCVLQVIPELETGGAERTTLDVAAALIANGDRAIVASQGGRMLDELLGAGAEHVSMPLKAKRLLTMRRNAARLAALMEEEAVDIIHARSRAPAWSALWAASWTYRPLVTTYHGAYNEKTRFKNLYNSVMARGDVVIANSIYTATLVAERHPFAKDRIVTIHRGIDLSRFGRTAAMRGPEQRARWGAAPDEPVILHLARLTPWKGQALLLEALAELLNRFPRDWLCVFAGDAQGRGDYRQRLVTLARRLGLERRIRFAGHVDDVAGAFAAADLAVLPSTEPEAFGRAAVEAQAAMVPVVVADHGAMSETVLAPPEVSRDNRTGWRVPPRDKDALADALFEALQTSKERLQEIGERGRAHALTHFSLDAMTEKTLGVYQSLLEDEPEGLY